VGAIGKPGQIQQDEGELKGSPGRRFSAPAGSPAAPAFRRRAALATASFISRNALRAISSRTTKSIPATIRSCAVVMLAMSFSAVSRRPSFNDALSLKVSQ